MSDAGKKILAGLKDALDGNFSAVTIDGQRWVRVFPESYRPPSQPERDEVARIIRENLVINDDWIAGTSAGNVYEVADAILSLTNGTEPGAVTDGRYVVRQENSDNLCGMTAWGECWSVIDAPDGPDAVSAQWVGFFINRAAAETIARALSRNSTDE